MLLSSRRRSSCNRPWGSDRFGSCRLAFRPPIRSVPLGAEPQGSRDGKPRSQVLPRFCPTLRSVSLVSSRPVVTDGRCPLAVTGRCGWPSRAVANRGADSAGGCRPQGLAPLPSPLARSLLPAALPRCSLGLVPGRGREECAPAAPARRTARGRGRSRNPGRTRVHPASRPDPTSEDEQPVLVGSEGSPRGSAPPAGSRHRAPEEPGGRRTCG
jgi:hypothetical protein